MPQEQQELRIFDNNQAQQMQEQLGQQSTQLPTMQNQNVNIEGLNANGNVQTSYMRGV